MNERLGFSRNVSTRAALPLALGAVLVLGSCCGRHGSHAQATHGTSTGGCCASETPAAAPEPGAAGTSAAGPVHAAEPPPVPEPAPAQGASVPAAVAQQTNCPVLGGAVNQNIFVEYQGKKVYFCCQGCPETFQADPAKYVAKLPPFAQARIGGPNQ